VSGRGESTSGWTARGYRAVAALAALLVLIVVTAVVASGCGGSDAQLAAFTGSWQRVVSGEPDPSYTLLVERSEDGTTLAFIDPSGFRAQGRATLREDYLVMEMPADNGIFDGATSLQVSLDSGGQLIVDRVLDDGTTEPVWVYDRATQP
jgi:hypothetical protein